jgi:hypothetical protein
MLGEKFPKAQFLITGRSRAGSNAHGPNEFLNLTTGKRLTAASRRSSRTTSRIPDPRRRRSPGPQPRMGARLALVGVACLAGVALVPAARGQELVEDGFVPPPLLQR